MCVRGCSVENKAVVTFGTFSNSAAVFGAISHMFFKVESKALKGNTFHPFSQIFFSGHATCDEIRAGGWGSK